MLYRFLRGLNEIYPQLWLAIFIGLAAIAMAFTVIYPLVPIVLIISSVFLVVAVRLVYLALRWAECRLALGSLASGRCPACKTMCDRIAIGERRIHECPGCRRAFDDKGDHYQPQPGDEQQPATFERTAEAI
jgi:hypothetical protein